MSDSSRTSHNAAGVDPVEAAAIRSLKRLAKRWPKSLMLFSGHNLYVGDARAHRQTGKLVVLDQIDGIYHDGGDPDYYTVEDEALEHRYD